MEFSAISRGLRQMDCEKSYTSDKRNPEKSNSYSKSYQPKQTKSEVMYCEKPDNTS